MTIDQSQMSDIGSGVAHARVFRALGAFVRAGGLVATGDLAVTGNPSTFSVDVGVGAAMVPLPGARQYYEPFIVDATENVALQTATANRVDLLYAGVKSKEFGDSENSKHLYVARGTDGSLTVPPAATMAATLGLAHLGITSGATRGTSVTITRLPSTTAPIRSGGYSGADLVMPQATLIYPHRTGVGSGGYITANNPCPFIPQMVLAVGLYPHSGVYRPSVFQPTLGSFDVGHFEGHWFSPDGSPLVNDPGDPGNMQFAAIMIPGTPLSF